MICGSDLRIFKEGSPRINVPRIIGHETSGVVVFSKMKKIKVGDRISLGADIDKKINFAFGYEIDGGFSQYMFLNKKIALKAPIAKRLKRAKKILKCETILFMKNNFIKKFYKKNKGFGSDYIFTANPSIETHKFALKIANKESFINFFGGVSKKNSKLLIDSNFIHYNEINLTGSHGSSHRQHKKALRMIENKKINLKPLITHKYNLKDINKAYKISLSGKAIKVSIRPN